MSAPLRSVGIDEIAEEVSLRDPSWVGRSSVTAVSRGAAAADSVTLPAFRVVADDAYVAAYRELRDSHDRYAVRRIFMMSIPRCTLAGPHLVALRDGCYVQETTRGAKSFHDPQAFSQSDDGVRVAAGATATRFDESVVAVGAAASRGYFHWMTEVVPRLQVVLDRGSLRSLPIIMRSAPLAFQRESLRWLGIRPRFVTEDLVRVSRAVIPSFPINPKRGGRYSPELIASAHAFRERYVPRRTDAGPRRIYVSRRDARKRRVSNEAELEAMLRAVGFTCLTLSDLPLDEQIHLFSNAEVVVAQHGAGLTNILFSRPGTRVVELYPRGFMAPSPFWTFAGLAELDYTMVICAVDPSVPMPRSGAHNADIHVDLGQVERVLSG